MNISTMSVTVLCKNSSEVESLVDWIENQSYCTVEFDVLPADEGSKVVITPYFAELAAREFAQFCVALSNL